MNKTQLAKYHYIPGTDNYLNDEKKSIYQIENGFVYKVKRINHYTKNSLSIVVFI